MSAAKRKLLTLLTISTFVAGFVGSARGEYYRSPDDSRYSRGNGGGDHPDLEVIEGRSPVSGPGPTRRFMIEIERAIGRGGDQFADEVEAILYDQRSWGGRGRLGMKRVDRGWVHFRITLAQPHTVDELCAPLQTNGIYSCFNGYRAVINLMRWRRGAATYNWDNRINVYQRYLINHEVGHALGHGHRSCPKAGNPAPVMMQQTKFVRPCKRNWWPLTRERGPRPDAS